MRNRLLVWMGALAVMVAVVSLAAGTIAGQAPSATAAKAYKAPRTPDGQPDLQGVWANNSATPLERPKALEDRAVLSDAEVAVLKTRASQLFNGGGDAAFGDQVYSSALKDAKNFVSGDGKTGDYNHFWLVDRDFDNRTSLVTTADGRIPPMTAEGKKKVESRRGRVVIDENGFAGKADSWEDRGLSERCITFGSPRLGAGYNSYYQIIQSRDYVAIYMETIHDSRIIPLDNRPHVSQEIRGWLGDSRGHWEGNTLVVDTTNYSSKVNFNGAAENLHTVERFTRVGPETLNYEVAVDDPTIWTKPWEAMIPLKRSNQQVYEYACHEGNSGLYGILAGARAEEKASEIAAKKGSN
jgi:hypothetical protein